MPSGRMGIFMRILVAEDEKILNSMITKTLTNEGYSVDSCYNGEDALHFLKMGEFDLVIMDIMMRQSSAAPTQ